MSLSASNPRKRPKMFALWNTAWRFLDWLLPRKWHRRLWWWRHPETRP